jgi:glycosyltransferase involved in cell wall biosynthesis
VKIAWLSNPPFVGSGYGVQTGIFGPRFVKAGYEIAFLANCGVEGWHPLWKGLKVYPADGDWGNRTMVACAANFGDGLEDVQVIALCDPWVLNTENWPKDELRIAIWAPVDHHPLPVPSRPVLAHECATPIAMSRFGERMMVEAGLDPLYVPHGVETAQFRPRPGMREEAREEMGLPRDAFVVGMVAANMGSPQMHRKAFPQAFQAFAKFRETHRDAVMYVHTNEWARGRVGLNLRALADRCGIPRKALKFTDLFTWEMGISRESLAEMYCAFDVLLNASMGEGFGVPLIEAQACGVPVIVSDHSSMTELVGPGWLIESVQDWYDGPQDAWFAVPSINGIVDALEQAYSDAGSRADAARAFAMQYDADRVTEYFWLPALRVLERGRDREVPPVGIVAA